MSQDQSTAKPGLRAIVYVRMSTLRQEDSPERQLQQCIPYANQKGYRLIGDPTAFDYPYKDLGLRGDDDRPGFDRVRADAQAGRFDVIVCDEWSRLSRQDGDDFVAEVRRPLRRAGVSLDTVKEGPQDWDTVGGRIMSEVHADAASGESKKIGTRVHSNARLLVTQGRPAGGGAPFGYRWEYADKVVNNRTKQVPVRLVPDGQRAEVLRKLFERYDGGDVSILDLVVWLKEGGVPPPRARKKGKTLWSRSAVRAVLKNDVYTGRYDYDRQTASKHTAVEGGIVVTKKGPSKPAGRKTVPITNNPEEKWVVSPIPHEALISQELFDRVQARLQKNRDGRNASQRDGYILSGLLVCGHCGRTLVGHRQKRSGALEYRCPSYLENEESPCKNAKVRQDQILDLLVEKLEQRYFNPQALNLLLAIVQQKGREERKSGNVARLKKNIDDLEGEINLIRERTYADVDAEVEAGKKMIAERKSQQDGLKQQLNDLTNGNQMERVEGFIRQMQESLWKLREARREGKWQWFRQVIDQAVERVAVFWETRVPKTGNTKYLHRVPLRGVVYLTQWLQGIVSNVYDPILAERLPLEMEPDERKRVLTLILSEVTVAEASADWAYDQEDGAEGDMSGAQKGSPFGAPEVCRQIVIPFSLVGC